MKEIYLAAGCFWGVEKFFDLVEGVKGTEAGYANGKTENPTYEDVCLRDTGHAETVKITYDPDDIGLDSLLKLYFEIIDPTSLNRQGNDVGIQYRTGVYFTDPEDEQKIKDFIQLKKSDYTKPIVVEVKPLEHFYTAEGYHQKYLEKNPGGYCHIGPDKFDLAEKAGKTNE